MEVAARCPAVGAVVGDGRGLDMTGTRRLQLAAQAGGAPVILARPESEMRQLSAAAMRWTVRPIVTDTDKPRWEVRLVRCKGVRRQNIGTEAHTWTWEWNHETGLVALPADVEHRQDQTAVVRQVG
jgi:protein ImuA